MMKLSKISVGITVFLFGLFLPKAASAFTFVESDMRFQVKLPRAWKKKVVRKDDVLLLRLRSGRGTIVARAFRKPDTDLDREIEARMDRLTKEVGPVKILYEKNYPKKKKGYTQMTIILMEYELNERPVYEISVFATDGEFNYHGVSGITPKEKFEFFKTTYYGVFRTLRMSKEKFDGRNDSERYTGKGFGPPPSMPKTGQAKPQPPEKENSLFLYTRPFIIGATAPSTGEKIIANDKPVKAVAVVTPPKNAPPLGKVEPIDKTFDVTDENFLDKAN